MTRFVLAALLLQNSHPVRPMTGPPAARGWEVVSAISLWPRATDPAAVLALRTYPNGVGMRYAVGGKIQTDTGMSPVYARRFRLVGWTRDGRTVVLPDRATNRKGELRPLVGLRIEANGRTLHRP